ncbi:hypothetical protein [Jiangella endophytica]|uniref:hypothetical protein n=1 Tax=Jiangella endophytica TaxID=1623398 RepID=UPI0013001C71|nr:hypothetical protein [Jiangella endophytica]
MRTVSRLLVLAALLLGIVLMHHVAGAGHTDGHSPAHEPTATHAAGHENEPSPSSEGHGLAHLCLAVLSAAALVLAGRLLLGRLPDVTRRARDVVLAGRTLWAWPPPRAHGAALLTSLGVSRT